MNNDLISREALQEEHIKECVHNCYYCKHFKWNANKACSFCDVIDNAPTVEEPDYSELHKAVGYNEGYAQGYVDGSTGADWEGEK